MDVKEEKDVQDNVIIFGPKEDAINPYRARSKQDNFRSKIVSWILEMLREKRL